MSDLNAYVGQIEWVSFDFEPKDWFFCDGRRLSISRFEKLYALIGETYGGRTGFFNLPDLRSRVVIGSGAPSQGKTYILGEQGGAEATPLVTTQMPSHTHAATFTANPGSSVQQSFALNAQTGVPATSLVSAPASGFTVSNTLNAATNTNPAIYAPPGSGAPVNLGGVAARGQVEVPDSAVVNSPAGSFSNVSRLQPYLVLKAIICWHGLFPSRP